MPSLPEPAFLPLSPSLSLSLAFLFVYIFYPAAAWSPETERGISATFELPTQRSVAAYAPHPSAIGDAQMFWRALDAEVGQFYCFN